MQSEDAKLLFERFVHREDVFAQQFKDGHYEPIRQPITPLNIEHHLNGDVSYGVYVVKPVENTVRWLVFDLDTMEPSAIEMLEVAVISFLEPYVNSLSHYWTEFSGSKGYHVWVFFDRPVDAGKVRRWVQHDFMPLWAPDGINDYPLEVFPKQDRVDADGFGNLVKLPYGVHAKSGGDSTDYLPGWSAFDPDEFPVEKIPTYEAPAQITHYDKDEAARSDYNVRESFFPCVNKIYNEGVGEGMRANAILHLALFYYGQPLIPEWAAVDLCLEANSRFDPPLPESEILTYVRTAYSGKYLKGSCRGEWLSGFCPGPCPHKEKDVIVVQAPRKVVIL